MSDQVYASPDEGGYQKINQGRFNLLAKQLEIYRNEKMGHSVGFREPVTTES